MISQAVDELCVVCVNGGHFKLLWDSCGYAANYNHKRVAIKILMKTDFLLQVIVIEDRKNLNCLVKIAILFGWYRWEWVPFPSKPLKGKPKIPPGSIPFFQISGEVVA